DILPCVTGAQPQLGLLQPDKPLRDDLPLPCTQRQTQRQDGAPEFLDDPAVAGGRKAAGAVALVLFGGRLPRVAHQRVPPWMLPHIAVETLGCRHQSTSHSSKTRSRASSQTSSQASNGSHVHACCTSSTVSVVRATTSTWHARAWRAPQL